MRLIINPLTGKLEWVNETSNHFGGFYIVDESEEITIDINRILYTNRSAVTNGTVIINGILEVN